MDRSVISTMYGYNDWANDRVLGVIDKVPESDLMRRLPGGSTSILETFAHIVCGEWIWLERWKGQTPVELPPWTSGGLATLAEHLNETRAERNQLLEAPGDLTLEAVVTYRNLAGDVSWTLRLGDMLLHVVNHSTYHRGQLASKLRQLGVPPPETDFLVYASQSPLG